MESKRESIGSHRCATSSYRTSSLPPPTDVCRLPISLHMTSESPLWDGAESRNSFGASIPKKSLSPYRLIAPNDRKYNEPLKMLVVTQDGRLSRLIIRNI